MSQKYCLVHSCLLAKTVPSRNKQEQAVACSLFPSLPFQSVLCPRSSVSFLPVSCAHDCFPCLLLTSSSNIHTLPNSPLAPAFASSSRNPSEHTVWPCPGFVMQPNALGSRTSPEVYIAIKSPQSQSQPADPGQLGFILCCVDVHSSKARISIKGLLNPGILYHTVLFPEGLSFHSSH